MKPPPVDVTGLKITKLPPGAAKGTELYWSWKRWGTVKPKGSRVNLTAKAAARQKKRAVRRDRNCLVARAAAEQKRTEN